MNLNEFSILNLEVSPLMAKVLICWSQDRVFGDILGSEISESGLLSHEL